ncbi:MAG: hypothetical protein LBV28_03390 [Puniceicoccales bacterium]|jgi:hypothetical protein|nr:hypothetical protein [Puniceicoccales bacterium]
MKTKHILPILAIGTVAIGAVACVTNILERQKAKITFVVKDDFGKPIPNVEFVMETFHHWEPGESFGKDIQRQYRGKTDATGKVVLNGQSINGRFACGMELDERYHDRASLRYRFKEKKNGRWEPWNPTIEIIYKPILKPIAMYHGEGRLKLPKRDEEIGFDLSLNDFVAPYGKGEQTDLIFKLEEKIPYASAYKPYDYRLKITFPNKGDGIQSWYGPINRWGLGVPRYAPIEGYESSLELKSGRDEKDYFKQREDQNYFFRVRTQLDENGKTKSTLYGKIVGNIDFWRNGTIEFPYYLNPTPLDVNMENDPKKNLIPPKKRR